MSGAYVIQSLPCSNNDKPYIRVWMCSIGSTGSSVNSQWYGHWWGLIRIKNDTDYCYSYYYYYYT